MVVTSIRLSHKPRILRIDQSPVSNTCTKVMTVVILRRNVSTAWRRRRAKIRLGPNFKLFRHALRQRPRSLLENLQVSSQWLLEYNHSTFICSSNNPFFFQPGNEERAVTNAELKDKTLTAYCKLNQENEEDRQYFYREIPRHFSFAKSAARQYWCSGANARVKLAVWFRWLYCE